MRKLLTILFATAAFLFVPLLGCYSQATEQERGWNKPVEPFRIAGNIYYVGAADITSYLITTPKGHILIDSGFIETVPQIKANVARLGFKLSDVKIILNSHAHYDHAGGIAELKRLTGAKLYASEPDSLLLANGGKGDPNFADRYPFEPASPDVVFKDGKQVRLGDVTMKALVTPGHTRGCTTWSTDATEKGKRLSVLFVCSTSVPGYSLVNNEKHPTIVDDYRATFRRLGALKPDIFLGSHGSIFDLEGKIERLRAGGTNPFIDPAGYVEYLGQSRSRFESTYKEQSSKKAGN